MDIHYISSVLKAQIINILPLSNLLLSGDETLLLCDVTLLLHFHFVSDLSIDNQYWTNERVSFFYSMNVMTDKPN